MPSVNKVSGALQAQAKARKGVQNPRLSTREALGRASEMAYAMFILNPTSVNRKIYDNALRRVSRVK